MCNTECKKNETSKTIKIAIKLAVLHCRKFQTAMGPKMFSSMATGML
jgi:hypothetical protein